MSVALLFIDGVGMGLRDPEVNPLARADFMLSRFEDGSGAALPPGGCWTAVDTCFGVSGRPQSASNQTAILTGEPAPRLLGRHRLGYPDAALRDMIAERSIVKRLVEAGRTATFANAYPAAYLDALHLARGPDDGTEGVHSKALRKVRSSATTASMAAGGVRLRTLADARAGEGLTPDLTGARARARGMEVPVRTIEAAAEIFARILTSFDFAMFEHFEADEAGHAQDEGAAMSALRAFDGFARGVVAHRAADDHILICSDHGNVEDLSHRNHTRNPVAVLYFGNADWVPSALHSVADVGTVILRLAGASP